MKGRPSAGKMKALWLERKARYLHRGQREQHQKTREEILPRTSPRTYRKLRRRRWKADGTKQPRIRAVVKDPGHGSQSGTVGLPDFKIVKVGGRKTPIVKLDWNGSPPTKPHDTHMRTADAQYYRRKVKARGHKVGRLNGAQRLAAFARIYWWKLGGASGGKYPSWDPLHRVPVDANTPPL
jgi:hypothetical protein